MEIELLYTGSMYAYNELEKLNLQLLYILIWFERAKENY